MDPVTKAIWQTFHVHHGDVPPFMGFEGTRDDLATLFADLGYTKGAEIGVQRGTYSEVLCKANPKLHLMLVDPWTPFTHHSQEWQDQQLARAVHRLQSYPNVEFIRKTSMEAVKEVPNGSLDFIYIDAMHDFDNVMMDLIAWVPKVRRDGIVSGHDYDHYFSCGVVPAVDAYVRAHNVGLYYITPKDLPRSFFWVKR